MKRNKTLKIYDPNVDYVARLESMGEVVTHPEPGTVDYVSDGHMLQRVDIAGTNVIINGRYREHVARISRKDFSSMVFGSMPAVQGKLEGIMPVCVDRGTPEWAEFMATRKIVREELPSGKGAYTVVPDFNFDGPSKVIPKVNRPRLYTLANVFSDSHLADKYGLTARMINSAKRLAISQPDEAARVLQGAMRQLAEDERIRVVAGPYSRSRQQCKNTVRHIAGKYPNMSASIQATVSGRKVLLYGPEGEEDWMVCGPVHHIDEVYDVYRMVWHVGTTDPMFLLGLELTILDIDIHNGEFFECPVVEGHAGSADVSLPARSSYETEGLLGAEGKAMLKAMTDRVLPIRDGVGRVVATSVRVTAKHVLQSEHVMEKYPDATIDASSVIPIRSISRDLWVARLDGPSVAWKLRKPVVGEQVFIVYSVGHEVQYSSPMRVESADGFNVLVSRVPDVVQGMSGGALVALEDFSLLGIHNGSTLRHNLCSQFGQEQYTDLCEADIMSQACYDEASASSSDNLYERYRRKGLGSVIDHVIGASVPLYVGQEHVAMSVHSSSNVYTTFDVDKASVRVGVDKLATVFEPSAVHGQFKAAVQLTGVSSPLVFRNPEYYEKVVLIGRDALGPYFSEELTVMNVGTSHRNFALSKLQHAPDLPMVGAAVVALSDAAVLGQYARPTVSVGLGHVNYCLPLRPDVVVRTEDPAAVLQGFFPLLQVSAWQEYSVEEVVTHSSRQVYDSGQPFNAGNSPLANIGDSSAKACLYMKLREAGMPHARWQSEMQRFQSNVAYAELAWKWGYSRLLRGSPGVSFPATSKAYADLTEALIGAVFLNESRETFEKFCVVLGVVPDVGVTTPKMGGEEASV